jgi:hypothetical protein
MVTIPVTVPGAPHGADELLLELLEPPELPELPELPEPQHMLELELLDPIGDCEPTTDPDPLDPEPDPPLDPELKELPHEIVLSIRSARMCSPNADAIWGRTVTSRTKLATAITAT